LRTKEHEIRLSLHEPDEHDYDDDDDDDTLKYLED
jgi:hypothetical protein